MRIVFFGTPIFAAHILQYLLDQSIDVVGVVTRPPRPKGRSGTAQPSPVQEIALGHGLPCFTPDKATDPTFLSELKDLQGDLFAVAAYGKILRPALLGMPSRGCINVHASLLPKYRGAAPIQRCLMEGERETGITIMAMAPQLDAGDIIRVERTPIDPEMTGGELEQRLGDIGMKLLVTVIREIERGEVERVPQNHSKATYAPKIEPADCQILWEKPADELHNLVRALAPRPGAWCWIERGERRQRLKIFRSRFAWTEEAASGKIFAAEKGKLIVGCGRGTLELLSVQPEGKRVMTINAFVSGAQTEEIHFV